MLCSLVELHIFPCKIYLTNMGLLRHLVKPESTAFGEGNCLFIKFKGAFIVNFVLQTRALGITMAQTVSIRCSLFTTR